MVYYNYISFLPTGEDTVKEVVENVGKAASDSTAQKCTKETQTEFKYKHKKH